jgi:AmmeMemoRadiSam system protein B
MRAASITLAAGLVAGLLLETGVQKTRKTFDDVGFCTTAEQIEAIIEAAEKKEKNELSKSTQRVAKVKPIAAISPHDDHLYAGRVYLHAVPHVASAKTVVVFGVTHRAARKLMGDPKDVLVFEEFDAWEGPYGPVEVDAGLRSHIVSKLNKKYRLVSSKAHATEHSIEAMIPFLQHENRDVRIVPVMVTEMSFEKMNSIAMALGKILMTYVKDNKLILGDDVAFLISVDTVHYGPDFEYSPFGVDAKAHEKARKQDMEIGFDTLSKTVTKSKIKKFTQKVWGEKIPWCGRFSVPFGLLAVQKTVKYVTGNKIEGVPMRYSDSYTLGVLPVFQAGIGTTAPFSLKHWVGYWSIVYGTPAG